MSNSFFDAEEEQEQNERASDPANFALCAAHIAKAPDFAEQFLRLLAFSHTLRARARWEEELPERQAWRFKYYKDMLKHERALQRAARRLVAK